MVVSPAYGHGKQRNKTEIDREREGGRERERGKRRGEHMRCNTSQAILSCPFSRETQN